MSARRAHGEGTIYEVFRTWTLTVDGAKHPTTYPTEAKANAAAEALRAGGAKTIKTVGTNPKYVGAVTIAGRRRKVSGKDKTEARAKLRALLAAKSTGTPVANRKTTVADAVNVFLERELPNRTRNGQPLSPSTIETYDWTAKIIVDEIGSVRLADLHVEDVEAMLDRLARRKKNPLAAASLRKVRGTLQRAIDFAVRRGDVAANVARVATITPKAKKAQTRRSLCPADAGKLLDAFTTERLGAMYALMLGVGLRPGEASALYWEDLDDGAVNVTRGVRLTNGRAEVVDDLKTATSKRTIELPAGLVDRLAAHRKAQAAERLAAAFWVDDRLVFSSPRGGVLSPPNVRRDLERICVETGVEKITPNELRHSCASLLSDEGFSNEEIADLLGHTTTRMVDQTYRHRLRPKVNVAARSRRWEASSADV